MAMCHLLADNGYYDKSCSWLCRWLQPHRLWPHLAGLKVHDARPAHGLVTLTGELKDWIRAGRDHALDWTAKEPVLNVIRGSETAENGPDRSAIGET